MCSVYSTLYECSAYRLQSIVYVKASYSITTRIETNQPASSASSAQPNQPIQILFI